MMFDPYDKFFLKEEQIIVSISTKKALGEIEIVSGISSKG